MTGDTTSRADENPLFRVVWWMGPLTAFALYEVGGGLTIIPEIARIPFAVLGTIAVFTAIYVNQQLLTSPRA